MYRFSKNIRLLLLALLLAVLPVAFAMGQTGVIYAGQTTDLAVQPEPGASYYWTLYCDPNVNFATEPGNCTNNEAEFVNGVRNQSTVSVKWNNPGTYFFKVLVMGANGCSNIKVGMVEVVKPLPTADLKINPAEICVNEPAFLTVTLTGEPLWGFTLQARDADGNINLFHYNNIDNSKNPFEITVSPAKTTWYTVIEVTDKYGVQKDPSNSVKLTVNPLPRSSRIYIKTE